MKHWEVSIRKGNLSKNLNSHIDEHMISVLLLNLPTSAVIYEMICVEMVIMNDISFCLKKSNSHREEFDRISWGTRMLSESTGTSMVKVPVKISQFIKVHQLDSVFHVLLRWYSHKANELKLSVDITSMY